MTLAAIQAKVKNCQDLVQDRAGFFDKKFSQAGRVLTKSWHVKILMEQSEVGSQQQ